MSKKANREWATRSEAIKLLAERPNMNASEAFAFLFNGTPSGMLKDAEALKDGILARKRAELARLQADVAAAEKAAANKAATPTAKVS